MIESYLPKSYQVTQCCSFGEVQRLVQQETGDEIIVGSFAHLRFLHQWMFTEYEWSGVVREKPLYKGHLRYVSPIYLIKALVVVESLPQNTFANIIDKYIEFYWAHPFLHGNHATLVVWLHHVLEQELDCQIAYETIDLSEYLLALESSAADGTNLKNILEKALVPIK